jgi:F0F1-type ATP synthase delta subunit
VKTPRARIAATVADHTLKQGVSKAYAREVAAYLLAERRVADLNSLLRDVQADWADKGHIEVIARSAHPLSDQVKRDIEARVKPLYPAASNVFVTEIIEPELIGGVQLSVANKQLDMSVEAKLNKFKQLTGVGKD